MEALWNKLDLQRPSVLTCQVPLREIDAKSFLVKINKIIKDLESQEMLHFEAALLGRLIYRMKCKFRSDKGLKNMEKTNRALLNYLKLCLENDYKYLKECIEFNLHSEHVILPTRQMMEYTLVKTQSFAKLMCRVESVSREAAHFLNSRIIIGQSWDVSLIALSVISRIWVLSRHLIKKSCNWYNQVYECTLNFKSFGAEWLPKNYQLPLDLQSWLKLPWIDQILPNISTHQEIKQNIFNLIKPSDGDSETELNFDVIDDINEISKSSSCTKRFQVDKETFNLKNVNERLLQQQQELNFPLESSAQNLKSSPSVKKFNTIQQTSFSKLENRKSLQELTSLPLGASDVGQKISRDAFNSFLENKYQEKQLNRDCKDGTLNQDEKKSLEKRDKRMKAKRELKYAVNSCDENPLNKKKEILTPKNLENENDLILFLKRKSYPGMDKLEWKKLKKNVRQFLVDINNNNESVSKKKKLKMVFKKIREWTS